MNKYKIINIIAAIIAGMGFLIQVKYDDRGAYIVLGALILSIINQMIKGKSEK